MQQLEITVREITPEDIYQELWEWDIDAEGLALLVDGNTIKAMGTAAQLAEVEYICSIKEPIGKLFWFLDLEKMETGREICTAIDGTYYYFGDRKVDYFYAKFQWESFKRDVIDMKLTEKIEDAREEYLESKKNLERLTALYKDAQNPIGKTVWFLRGCRIQKGVCTDIRDGKILVDDCLWGIDIKDCSLDETEFREKILPRRIKEDIEDHMGDIRGAQAAIQKLEALRC